MDNNTNGKMLKEKLMYKKWNFIISKIKELQITNSNLSRIQHMNIAANMLFQHNKNLIVHST